MAEEKELSAILNISVILEKRNIFDKIFYISEIDNIDVVIVKSNVGKVNSSRVCQLLIDNFQIKLVINIGTAGSVDNSLNIGDIVISDKLYQYDFDVTPFGRKLGEIENIGDYIQTNKSLLEIFKGKNVFIGNIASGDKFIVDINEKKFINTTFSAKCIEMEGASIAQVCYLCNKPFLIIRVITDKLDGSSKVEFEHFLELSSKKCSELLKSVISDLEESI